MRLRIGYILIAIITIFLALFIRSQWSMLPYWINFWIGDFLWAIMLYWLMLGVFMPHNRLKATSYLILFCWLIETSQLWHTTWLDNVRATRLGGLLLGHGFLWSDIVAYTLGVFVAYLLSKKNFR